jgi:hypothetical protein
MITELKKEILRIGNILEIDNNVYYIITSLINEYDDRITIIGDFDITRSGSFSYHIEYIDGKRIVVPYEAIVLIAMIALGIDKKLTTSQKGVLRNDTIERLVTVNLSISKPMPFLVFTSIMIKVNLPIECFERLFDKLEWLDDVTDEEIGTVINALNKFNSPDITAMFIKFIRDNTCNDMEDHIEL